MKTIKLHCRNHRALRKVNFSMPSCKLSTHQTSPTRKATKLRMREHLWSTMLKKTMHDAFMTVMTPLPPVIPCLRPMLNPQHHVGCPKHTTHRNRNQLHPNQQRLTPFPQPVNHSRCPFQHLHFLPHFRISKRSNCILPQMGWKQP